MQLVHNVCGSCRRQHLQLAVTTGGTLAASCSQLLSACSRRWQLCPLSSAAQSQSWAHPTACCCCCRAVCVGVQAYKHEAILGLYVCFVHEIHLWMVMPYMEVRQAATQRINHELRCPTNCGVADDSKSSGPVARCRGTGCACARLHKAASSTALVCKTAAGRDGVVRNCMGKTRVCCVQMNPGGCLLVLVL